MATVHQLFKSGTPGYPQGVETDEDQTGETSLQTLQDVTPIIKESIDNISRIKNIMLSNIGVIGYKLIEPLQVSITFEENMYVAVSYDINMFGYGDTESEAIQDLRESIIEYYVDLKEDQANLGKIPRLDFEYLKSTIKEED